MIRLAHFSDLHLTAKPLGWTAADWFSKRLTGWMNLTWFGRAYRFRDADRVVAALVADLERRRPDWLVFSGDATTLGFESEFARAARLLKVGNGFPGIAVPGNHDYYTPAVSLSGLFERYFAPWQQGQRLDQHPYPFAQDTGELWLVAVNSSTGNRWSWDAGGAVDRPQLDRLAALLDRLDDRPRILVTHFPVCLRNGQPESLVHRLRNARELVDVAARGRVALWLHGHRHDAYFLPPGAAAPFSIVCGGSATQNGRWTYHEYAIDGRRLHATRRTFDPAQDTFVDRDQFELDLRL
jgi:3',5'-cyclic AMP phosphodiesterase CpdA